MEKKPIFYWMQAPPSEAENVPFHFSSNLGGKFGAIQSELNWRMNDFCRIHQIVYKEINFIDNKLDSIEIIPFTEDINDPQNIITSRKLEYVNAKGIENNQITMFVDHMTVVGLWAICEQFLGRIFKSFVSEKNGVLVESVQAPYKWDDFIREYANFGIDLTRCENYINANECRVLNNAIKHDPTVNSRLATFSYFIPYANQNLEQVSLEMQRYVNGVSDFLGSLIEIANSRI